MLENNDRPKTAYCPFPPSEYLGFESLDINLNHGDWPDGILVYLIDLPDLYVL